MTERVHISGIEVQFSALGNSVEANLDALLNERTGIGPITRLQTRHSETLPGSGGEVGP